MAKVDDKTRTMLEAGYREFHRAGEIDVLLLKRTDDVEWTNAREDGYVRGRDEVLDYWSRQRAEIGPTVTAVHFAALPHGPIDVTIHQVTRDVLIHSPLVGRSGWSCRSCVGYSLP